MTSRLVWTVGLSLAAALFISCDTGGGGGSSLDVRDSVSSVDVPTDLPTPVDAGDSVAPADVPVDVPGAFDAGDGGPTVVWGTCPDDPLATTEGLAEKAAEYDRIARELHLHPRLKWMAELWLPTEPCDDGTCLSVPLSEATWEDVVRWDGDANDGAWSSVYLASQAYRYGATGSAEALENIRTLLAGLRWRTEITGTPGTYVRQYIPPDIPGLSCPESLSSYVPLPEKDGNRWVRVGEDGCLQVVDEESQTWVTTERCVPSSYAGWCFKDSASQDEYAGHMLALAALWKLVDDEAIRADVAELATAVGVHLMENKLEIVDWDGRATEYGHLHPLSAQDAPGFLAMEALAWVRLAVETSGRDDLRAFYEDCLLQRAGRNDCLPSSGIALKPFTDYLPFTLLFPDATGCGVNFNNISMLVSAYQVLLLVEDDPEVRTAVREALRDEVMLVDNRMAPIHHGNPWYSFLWAAYKPAPEEPALAAVEEAICSLRQFPPTQQVFDFDPTGLYEHYCTGRLDNSLAEDPIPVAHRCPKEILFWRNAYERKVCEADPGFVRNPGDYLLGYWMGRYYGFISEDL